MRVQLYIRKSFEGQHSIENVFDAITLDYGQLKNHLKEARWLSKGVINRLLILFQVWYHRNELNHITGDITFAAIGLPNPSKTIITFHDFLFLNRRASVRTKLLKKLWLDLPLERAKHITTVSEYTKRELLRLKPNLDPNSITVIYNPVHPIFTPRNRLPNNEIKKVLLVGVNPNKNLNRIFKALEGLSCFVTILGALNDAQRQAAQDAKLNFLAVRDLSLEGVRDIYYQSDILLFASTAEGFGLPVIEAQACGVPVITSNTSSLPEISNGSALLVDPYNIDEIRCTTECLLFDERLKSKLITLGFENAKRFDVSRIRKKYLSLYKSILRQPTTI